MMLPVLSTEGRQNVAGHEAELRAVGVGFLLRFRSLRRHPAGPESDSVLLVDSDRPISPLQCQFET